MNYPIRLKADWNETEIGLRQLGKELPFTISENGFPVTIQKGDGLSVSKTEKAAYIVYKKPAEIFRGLGLLSSHMEQKSYETYQHAAFERNGVMFDCSRNAVLTTDAMKFFLNKMALFGLSVAMLYTEDTYEVEGQPYFGYCRGRFTKAELKELDDYAYSLGIEMVPCIQCLAHLNQFLRWDCTANIRDDGQILLVDEEKTYQLLEQLLKNATEPFRTKRIHIGMDEAWGLGDGNYKKLHGYVPRDEIMAHHLKRVSALVEKLGLEAMMWSDMHFRALNNNVYDVHGLTLPQSTLDAAPEKISLVYWDYYAENREHYEEMLNAHARFKAKTIFAGGIWVWYGPAPMIGKTVRTTQLALTSCKKHGIKEVFATAWGDNGAECNYTAILYGMAMFAQMDYLLDYEEEKTDREFERVCHLPAQTFKGLDAFNILPGVSSARPTSPFNPVKPLLYEDPLVLLLEKDFENVDLEGVYAPLAKTYHQYSEEYPEYHAFFDFYAKLADVLMLKGRWHKMAPRAVRQKDREAAMEAACLALENKKAVQALKDSWYTLWNKTNKPFGYEVIDVRLSGLSGRFGTAQKRLEAFSRGEVEDIPELSCEKLPFTKTENGYEAQNVWSRLVSCCPV